MFQTAAPFLAWAGGKRWLVTRFQHLFPIRYNAYHEPFLGSGAVFFHLKPPRGYLSDTNEELVITYTVLRDDPYALQRCLQVHKQQHSTEHFYVVREDVPTCAIERAARFLYLNRTCWNGLYRVNRSGQFNVPIGTKNQIIYPYDDFGKVSELLQGTRIEHCDFEEAFDRVSAGDFVFVDPPYTVKHNLNGFVKYNESIFTWADQVRLHAQVLKARDKGALVLVTNADHDSVRELYKGAGQLVGLERQSVLSGNPANRSATTELAIAVNYEFRDVP